MRPVAEVRRLTQDVIGRLYDRGIKAAVIACNTATSAAIGPLRAAGHVRAQLVREQDGKRLVAGDHGRGDGRAEHGAEGGDAPAHARDAAHGRLEMLRMPDTMAYPISFGDAKRAYPWSVLADFIRIARAQYPQPV